ncbi:2'-deoxycytidine 5'-triphosphate deaminase [Afipia felis]|uniref:2'-deoxycytidine 5'-triphosphate deaminase n=1 Tax=Afipia felis TaxID=1035 RepID=A0A090MTN9_AFIFE|nr:2'-deoxycytidine 5'-triphosphate deaminase [Afipia felis]
MHSSLPRGPDLAFSLPANANGILPDRMIAAMEEDGLILPAFPFVESQIQPASLDLRLGEVAYRVRASFLPGPDVTVAERIDELKLHEVDLSDGAVLETNCVYIVPLLESLALPPSILASANPKSSTGRLDVFTRVIADGTRRFDMIGAGYHGPLYAEISPKTFPVLLRQGSRLSQVRFRTGMPQLNNDELEALHQAEHLVDCENADLAGGVAVSVDLSGEGSDGFVGYRAKRHTGVVDIDRRGGYAVDDFWEPIRARPDHSLILDPGEFYILASKEAVSGAAELRRRNGAVRPIGRRIPRALCGLLRSGGSVMTGAGGQGSRAVLEVRSREVPFILEHGQIVGRLVYEKMLAPPQTLYGTRIASNYQGQGLKLSKHFRAPV